MRRRKTNEDGLVDQGCRSGECDRTEGAEVRGIRVAIDVVAGWVRRCGNGDAGGG